MVTKWTKHEKRWENCQQCELAKVRKNVVLNKGDLPCDILFLSEAPGAAENLLGKAFAGQVSHFFDSLLEQTVLSEMDLKVAYTYLVACYPKNDTAGYVPPPKASIKACLPRLYEYIDEVAKPKLIIGLGSLVEKWVETDIPMEHIMHPGVVTKLDISQKGLAIQRCTVMIDDAIDEVFN